MYWSENEFLTTWKFENRKFTPTEQRNRKFAYFVHKRGESCWKQKTKSNTIYKSSSLEINWIFDYTKGNSSTLCRHFIRRIKKSKEFWLKLRLHLDGKQFWRIKFDCRLKFNIVLFDKKKSLVELMMMN